MARMFIAKLAQFFPCWWDQSRHKRVLISFEEGL